MTRTFDELEVRRELKIASERNDGPLDFALKNNITLDELQNAIVGNDPPNAKMLNAIGFDRVVRYVRRTNGGG